MYLVFEPDTNMDIAIASLILLHKSLDQFPLGRPRGITLSLKHDLIYRLIGRNPEMLVPFHQCPQSFFIWQGKKVSTILIIFQHVHSSLEPVNCLLGSLFVLGNWAWLRDIAGAELSIWWVSDLWGRDGKPEMWELGRMEVSTLQSTGQPRLCFSWPLCYNWFFAFFIPM